MPGNLFDANAPSVRAGLNRRSEELPHGLLVPPPQVLEQIENERQKHSPAAFARSQEQLLNDWTLAYYFDFLGHEVLYRPTPQGPEVLAVGVEEILDRTDCRDAEKMKGLRTWTPL